MNTNGKLILIPSLLGETPPEKVVPHYNLQVILGLDVFVVEELKTARRFLRKCGYKADFDNITLFVLNEHTAEEQIAAYLEPVFTGKSIGLLSEAGCPAVADPGNTLVRMAHEKGIQVVPLSGPSSIIMSLMASGLNGQEFIFHGYLPARPPEREKRLKEIEREIQQHGYTHIFIETPYRNNQMIASILKVCSTSLNFSIAVNITTENEFIRTSTIAEWRKTNFEPGKQPAVFLLGR
ncbi:MAG: SAM-dependent methyltransferase [Lentimicrobium sp.]|jgi:16S rRNA (cytidine1402-2'-O)-methyltransferase|nr:SAM-dependent methyltransferase [Lentimicrobium sp.]